MRPATREGMPDHDLINGLTAGKLRADHFVMTPITGFDAHYKSDTFQCWLYPQGLLRIKSGSEWDFGTGALDTPSMVISSLPHDAFCLLTDAGKLPWSVRRRADNFLAAQLLRYGARGGRFGWRTALTFVSTCWRWAIVNLNSQLNARRRRQPYVPA